MIPYCRPDRYTLAILGLIGMMLVLHFAIVDIPRAYVFDEFYYVPQALAFLSGSRIPLWHPPLGLLLIAFGIAVFGDRGLGWRFSSVVFGVLSIGVLYLLVNACTRDKRVALFSSTLYAFDSLIFVQSSIAMLDIFFVCFMLVGFLLYWRNNRMLASIMMALSTLCKLIGVMGFGVLVVMMLIEHEEPRALLKRAAVYVLSVALVFWGFLLVQGLLVDPFSTLIEMAWKNVFSGPVEGWTLSSQPWDWLVNQKPIPYYVAKASDVYEIRYRGLGNSMIWLLTVPAIIGVAYDYLRHGKKPSLFVLVWFVMVYLVPWYPIALLSPRSLYLFYFLPAVGAVTTSISIGVASISELLGERLSKTIMSIYL